MKTKIDNVLGLIEKLESELKENGNKTAITCNDIRFLKDSFSEVISVYNKAEIEINNIINNIEKHINSIF